MSVLITVSERPRYSVKSVISEHSHFEDQLDAIVFHSIWTENFVLLVPLYEYAVSLIGAYR